MSGAPEDVIQKMKHTQVLPANVVERLVKKSLRAIAEIEPYIEKLSIADIQLITEMYDSYESVKHQAESIAATRYSSPRTLYRMRLEILKKIDKAMPAVLSDEEREALFIRRWHR